jgi:hypothetical protein
VVDHNQRFKSLLKTFFAEFFQAFSPAWADRFDFSGVDWLEQEAFTDPPRGGGSGAPTVQDRRGAQAMPMTSFEKGLQQGQRMTLQRLLEAASVLWGPLLDSVSRA